MRVVKDTLSEELFTLFLQWQDEYEMNIEHDINEVESWNALVTYLTELEKGAVKDT